ncbi:hypothetical protein DL769_009960 [Monosporascus sp. CRB-8-3]|nr:hypothetical protein DL769_009960 [Monosporascus sp. CRB-8-3]
MRLLFVHAPLVAAVLPSTVTEGMAGADSAPQLLNALVECKEENRECVKGYHFDSTSDDMIARWHDNCSPYLTFTPTTPILTPLSTTMDMDGCKSAYDACLRQDDGVKLCAEAYSASPTEVTSCLCQPTHLSVASVCYVDRTKCILTETANISTVLEYSYCQPAWLSSVAQPVSALLIISLDITLLELASDRRPS